MTGAAVCHWAGQFAQTAVGDLEFGRHANHRRPQGDGIALVSVELSLEAPTHEAAMQAVLDIARPNRGYGWEELDVEADAEAKRVRISGKVLTVMAEAAE